MQLSLKTTAFVVALALANKGSSAFEIENPTTDVYSTYAAQEAVAVGNGTTYVASGGPSQIASGNCTFDVGTTNEWTIKSQNQGDIAATGCYDVTTASKSKNNLPRGSTKSAYDPTAFDSTDKWCFIGEVNDGSSNADNAGIANYNAKDGQTTKWAEWAYCSEEASDMEYRYTSIQGYSVTDESMNVAGYPCAGEWNFNNGTYKTGVASSCLPFADFKPQTEGLDLSGVPEAEQKYWCYLEPGDDSVGYNPLKMNGDSYDDKVYQWGFCQDAEDPYTSAPTGDAATDAPTASPTETETATTESPTTEASGNATSAPTDDSTESTEAPTTSGGGSSTPSPTAGSDSGNSGEAPSSAAGLSVSVLLATAVAALAL